jgi:hypothetical protein
MYVCVHKYIYSYMYRERLRGNAMALFYFGTSSVQLFIGELFALNMT